MTSVRDIYDFLDSIAPFGSQMEHDHSGLQVGGFAQEVSSAMVCLDITPEVVAQAVQAGCELAVSHHPVMYLAHRQILSSDPPWLLARHGISAISSHTPLDRCPGGVNDILAGLLGLEAEPSDEMFRLCKLPEPLTAKAFAALAKERLGVPVCCRDAGKPIVTVAVCGGSGAGFLEDIYGRAGAYITGEVKYHDFLDAERHGLSLLTAGHFETEVPVVPVLAGRLREAFPTVTWHIAEEKGVYYA